MKSIEYRPKVKAVYMQCFEIFQLNYLCFLNRLHCFLGEKNVSQHFLFAKLGQVKLAQSTNCYISSTMTVSNHHRLCNRTIFFFLSKCKTPPTSSVINHSHIDFHLSLTTRVFPQYNLHCCSIHRIYLQAFRTRSDILKVKIKCQFAVLIILMGAC